MKDNVYFEVSGYLTKYLDLFAKDYLNGNRDSLIIDGQYNFYIKDELYYLMSSAMVYSLSFMGLFFDILLYIHPLIIFYLNSKIFHDEIHTQYYILLMKSQGKKKYIVHLIIKTITIGVGISCLPRLLYLIFCIIFFPNGYSEYNFENSYLIEQIFRFTSFTDNPYQFILADLGMVSLYGVLISILSLFVILISASQIKGYSIFVLLTIIQTNLVILIKGLLKLDILSPWIYGFSLFHQVYKTFKP